MTIPGLSTPCHPLSTLRLCTNPGSEPAATGTAREGTQGHLRVSWASLQLHTGPVCLLCAPFCALLFLPLFSASLQHKNISVNPSWSQANPKGKAWCLQDAESTLRSRSPCYLPEEFFPGVAWVFGFSLCPPSSSLLARKGKFPAPPTLTSAFPDDLYFTAAWVCDKGYPFSASSRAKKI